MCIIWNYKNFREKIKFSGPGQGRELLMWHQRTSCKIKIDKQTSPKCKPYVLQTVGWWEKSEPVTERKHPQTTHASEDRFLEHGKSTQSLTVNYHTRRRVRGRSNLKRCPSSWPLRKCGWSTFRHYSPIRVGSKQSGAPNIGIDHVRSQYEPDGNGKWSRQPEPRWQFTVKLNTMTTRTSSCAHDHLSQWYENLHSHKKPTQNVHSSCIYSSQSLAVASLFFKRRRWNKEWHVPTTGHSAIRGQMGDMPTWMNINRNVLGEQSQPEELHNARAHWHHIFDMTALRNWRTG